MHAILDGRTGQFISFGYGSSMGLRYTLKSRLLVVNPSENALKGDSPPATTVRSLAEIVHTSRWKLSSRPSANQAVAAMAA